VHWPPGPGAVVSMDLPDELRCQAKTTSKRLKGMRCSQRAVYGDRYCWKHARESAAVVVEGRPSEGPVRVQAEAVAVLRGSGVEVSAGDELEPVDVMAWVVLQTTWITEGLMGRLRKGEVLSASAEAADIRAALEGLTHVRRAAESAESAGMQRRRVAIEEAKVRTIAMALERAIDRAGLPAPLEQRLRLFVGEELEKAAA
jgi:hypothetical protein